MSARVRWLATSLWLVCLAVGVAGAGVWKMPNPSDDLRLGRQLAAEFERTHTMSQDAASRARVERVGRAVVEQLEQRMFPYQFGVVATREINAVCLPGGFIYVYDGLLARCENDEMLAAVIAHEVAHAHHRHWALEQTKLKDISLLGGIASVLVGDPTMSLGSALMTLSNLHYSRGAERDADRTAIELMSKAGYDPDGAIRLFELFAREEKGSSTPRYLRSHPPAKDRLAAARRQIDKLVQSPPAAEPAASPPPAPAPALPAGVWGTLPVARCEANPWFPLAVGHEWRYTITPGGAAYSLRIVSAAQLEAGTVYRAEMTVAGTPVPSQLLTTAGEVWQRTRPSQADSPWKLLYLLAAPEPVTRGGWRYQVVGQEVLDLPCGHFSEALHVRRQGGDPPATYDEWFAPGVGLLQRVCAETGVTETLVRYILGKP